MKYVLFIFCFLMLGSEAHAASRIKDIVTVEGIRENMLVGYGLVVGLNGTGDKLTNTAFTEKSLMAFLERLGINTRGDELKTKNVAAVTVTASLTPFARAGGRLDVTVSTLGDATNLQGGVLLATPLLGADSEVYAVAQGSLATEGFSAKASSGSSLSKGVPTKGFIPEGAIVEREVGFDLNKMRELNLALRNPDISTARRIETAINERVKGLANMRDPGTVTLTVPESRQGDVATLLAEIEQIQVTPDQTARVVIDEASGTIVMGENVRISTVAVAQGNLVVRVDETPLVSQPSPFSGDGAETVVVPRSNIDVDEGKGNKMAIMQNGTTLQELVAGLNALGVGPRDLISILNTIKAAGAMQAEVEAR